MTTHIVLESHDKKCCPNCMPGQLAGGVRHRHHCNQSQSCSKKLDTNHSLHCLGLKVNKQWIAL